MAADITAANVPWRDDMYLGARVQKALLYFEGGLDGWSGGPQAGAPPRTGGVAFMDLVGARRGRVAVVLANAPQQQPLPPPQRRRQ